MQKYGETLFEDTAMYYKKYRPPYPASLIRFIVDYFKLDGNKNLLDIGCGTGQLTLRFFDWVEKIVGIDFDKEMIKEAELLSEVLRINNVDWQNKHTSEFLKNNKETYDVVILAKAFHWFEREELLKNLFNVVRPEGGIVIIDNQAYSSPRTEWQKRLDSVVGKWYGQERRAGNSVYHHPNKTHATVIEESNFKLRTYSLPNYNYIWSYESILGNLYSTSYGSKKWLGENQKDFEAELKNALFEINDNNKFYEEIELKIHMAIK